MFVAFDTVSKMYKSKATMQKHKRKQSQMNLPTSHNSQKQSKPFPTNMQTAGVRPSFPTSAFQAGVRPSFPTHMQTTAVDNTNHPSSAIHVRPSFLYNMPPSSSHMQTTGEASVHNTNHLSSSFQPTIRPSFLYNMRQNSSSSSSSLQASVRPSLHASVHHNSSSSASSSHSQSMESQPTVHEPVLQQSSPSDSNHDQDPPDEYEMNLLTEVEIIGN